MLATLPGPGKGLLAAVTHTTGTETVYTPGASMADVDATNLAITFVAPKTGVVVIDAQSPAVINAPGGLFLGLRTGSTDVAGTQTRAFYESGTSSSQVRIGANWVITGLTPGASYTYKLAAAQVGAAGAGTLRTGGASNWGTIAMTVTG